MFQLRKIKAEKIGSLESNFHFPALRELGFSQLLLNGVGGGNEGSGRNMDYQSWEHSRKRWEAA